MTTGGRVRQLKRLMLHQRNKVIRDIWKSHINYLENKLEE